MKVLSEEAIADLSKTLDLVKAGRAKAAKSCQCPHCGPDRDYERAIDDMVEEIDTLSDALIALNAVRVLGENASRTFQSVVDRAEKAERELAGSRELLIEWVRYGYRMGMEGTDETGDADCKCLACRSSARLGRSE